MSGNITGEATDVLFLDNVCYEAVWSGASPDGELIIEVTGDNITETGVVPTWIELDFGAPIPITGNSGNHLINVNQTPFRYIRPRYARSSGTGTLNIKLTSKQGGG